MVFFRFCKIPFGGHGLQKIQSMPYIASNNRSMIYKYMAFGIAFLWMDNFAVAP